MNGLAFILLAAALTATAADFENEIRPLFQKHCIECHGEKKRKGELRLDAKPFTLKGGMASRFPRLRDYESRRIIV